MSAVSNGGKKPRLLDLFCGAGGCTKGYQQAGFYVVGVDINAQPNYCGDEFVRADALKVLRDYDWDGLVDVGRFDALHASPPCQRYIRGGLQDTERHPDLLGPTRDLLETWGLPWVMENVPGAPMRPDVVLCGSHFGLKIRRHRWFEVSWGIPLMTNSCDHSYPIHGVYGGLHGQQGAWPGMLPDTLETRREALGIDWMTADELADAIPPAYTEFIGYELLKEARLKREFRTDAEHLWSAEA